MYPRHTITNNRSLINSSYLMHDELSVIGIYGTDQERFLYVEYGQTNRTLDLYYIQFKNGQLYSDLALHWKKTTLIENGTITLADLDKLTALKSTANFCSFFQVNKDDMALFNKHMNNAVKDLTLNGEQDDDINRALKAIHQPSISVPQASCTIL